MRKSRFLERDVITTLIIVLLLIVALYTRIVGIHVIAVVEGHSMEPTLNTGDVVFIIPVSSPRDITAGDVIVFKRLSGELVIHRVIGVRVVDGVYYYITKGDNNPLPDPPNISGEPGIRYDYVVGKIYSIGNGRVFKIPYIGVIPLIIYNYL
ncbi:MAG: signal peptidase I [Sulfolobales archaeon]